MLYSILHLTDTDLRKVLPERPQNVGVRVDRRPPTRRRDEAR